MNSTIAEAWQRIFNDVGKRLDADYHGGPIRQRVIMDAVRTAGRHIGSGTPQGWPTDYCYNRINRGGGSFRFPVFKQVGSAEFRYLGPGFPYTGDITWPEKGKPARVVGSWTDGKAVLTFDPRASRR